MKSEKGFSLIEVALAIALLGIIAIAFLGALASGSKIISISDELATAESLARSQMEYVKNQPYDDVNNPPLYTLLSDIPDGYDIVVSAARLDYYEDGYNTDDGIQTITVAVSHLGKPDPIVTLEGYKLIR